MRLSVFVFCAFVCLTVFHTMSQKTPAAKIINKLYTDAVHHESWTFIYFGIKKSKVNVTRHKNVVGVGRGAGFFGL